MLNLMKEKITLRELTERIKELSDDYDVWIEGIGNGEIKIHLEEKYYTI